MKKGVYRKENKNQKAKRLREQKVRKQRMLCVGILLVVVIVVFIVLVSIRQENTLEGKWYMDDVTAYEFYAGGKGAMILPSAEYEFTYSITDNILNIDFKYEGAKDAEYTFVIEGDTLILNGGNATTQGEYVLTKLIPSI